MANIKEIDELNEEVDKLKKENVIDRESRNKRQFDHLRVGDGSPSRYSMVAHSRVSDIEMIENERLGVKLTEKNKEY